MVGWDGLEIGEKDFTFYQNVFENLIFFINLISSSTLGKISKSWNAQTHLKPWALIEGQGSLENNVQTTQARFEL